MTTYRVGDEGATVIDSDGRVLCRLSPGTVVVPGTIEAAAVRAEQTERKRVRGYADKRLRPTEDKSS
jgi:hypothetical protein